MTLGDDWEGVSAFVLADVDGLTTVVGVDAVKGRAESLAVVPQQADDGTRTVSPQIVALADGRRLVTVPRRGGGSDRRYLLDPRARSLDGMGIGVGPSRVLPGKTLVGEVAGLPDARTGDTRVLVKAPGDWATKRQIAVPGTVRFLASDPASDAVCLATDRTVFVARLNSGDVEKAAAAGDVAGLACPGGRPVVVVTGRAGDAGGVALGLRRTVTATTVTVRRGRVDAVAATATSVVLAVADGKDTQVVEIDAGTGEEMHRVRVPDHPASLALTRTDAGWLLYDEKKATRVDLATGRTTEIDLPGTLLDE
ncbi:hypothetical protein AB0E88_28075 [Streptomyces sp. NPDC028635]|uniref:hypothetical protein n=1 Tax=Streptomyces sp. NPDC028635 TaxID=3154800 RepID=UPI0033E73072